MKTKTTIPQLTKDDIKVGRCYSAKKPKRVMIGFYRDVFDDKQILHISPSKAHREYIFIDYTPEYKEWVKKSNFRTLSSEYDQSEFESEFKDKYAKIIEMKTDYIVQYDSPTVKNGKHYPTMPMEKFLAWVGADVTDIMPSGDWRDWVDNKVKAKESVK